ncbi:MAG: hypothetical protein HQM09_14775 [Candidatus Riflebacteria bacterium]|nr:hypothetical protein [Candidatus Riflebacteria bacterium]
MNKLVPVSQKTPDYPGFRPRRRFLEGLALFLRIEITLPICLLLTLSCARLNAESPALDKPENQTTIERRAVETPAGSNLDYKSKTSGTTTPAGNVEEVLPCTGDTVAPARQELPPPCKGSVVAPPPVPCGGAPVLEEPKPQPSPLPPPCSGKVAPPRENTIPGTLTTSVYKDVSLDDVIKNPQNFVGMNVQVQGFLGKHPAGTGIHTGFYLDTDIQTSRPPEYLGLPLSGPLPPLEAGVRAIVEGTIIQLAQPKSGQSYYAIQIQKFRTH